MSCMRLSEGGCQSMYPFSRNWSSSIGVIQVLTDTARKSHIGICIHDWHQGQGTFNCSIVLATHWTVLSCGFLQTAVSVFHRI